MTLPTPHDRSVSPRGLVQPAEVKPARHFWTNREVETLKRVYPGGGIRAAIKALPHRSTSSIYQRANALKLRRPSGDGRRAGVRWTTTPHIDEAIRRSYAGDTDRGRVNRLAEAISRPRGWVRDRALKLGCVVPAFKAAAWSAEEDAILTATSGLSPQAVVARLAKAGFRRSKTAVVVRRKRRRMFAPDDPDVFTGAGLAEVLGVNDKTVTTWIERGWLAAKPAGARRSDGRVVAWRITRKNARRFVIDHLAHVDFRKADKWSLCGLLTGEGAA